MAVQLSIPYEALLALVDQLPDEQKQALAKHLKQTIGKADRTKTRLEQYHAGIIDIPVLETPSIRREDWYNDHGR